MGEQERLGHAVLDAIIEGAMVQVECVPREDGTVAHVFRWQANAAEQLGAAIAQADGRRMALRALDPDQLDRIERDLRRAGRFRAVATVGLIALVAFYAALLIWRT